MKISELLKELLETKKSFGDIEVVLEPHSINDFGFYLEYNEEVKQHTLKIIQ